MLITTETAEPVAMTRTNPFVGLRPFQTDESLLFFGRRQQTIELLERLHRDHFIAVVGSSGCGKSSLIRAGLIPKLLAGFLVEDRDVWRIATLKPGDAPLHNLAAALSENSDESAINNLQSAIAEGGVQAIGEHLEPALPTANANLLLLIDQFEELFRFGIESGKPEQRNEATDFVAMLLQLAAQRRLPIYVVLTMRSDFIGDCDHFYGLPEALNRSQFLVSRLTREQRRQAIEGPIRLFNADLTPRLLDRVVNDVGDHSDQLPVMQHALMRTWEHREKERQKTVDGSQETVDGGQEAATTNDRPPTIGHRPLLDLPHYQAVGGIQSALARDADAALQSLTAEDQTFAKRLFQALTDTDARNRRIRRPAKLSELASITGVTEEKVLALIENFKAGGRSFLTLSQDADPIVDISHESLIRQWAMMGEWVDEEVSSRNRLLRLVDAAKHHQKYPKDENFWRGSQLEVASEWWETRQPNDAWASRYADDFALAQTFLEQSREAQANAEAAREAHRLQSRRRTQSFFIMLSFALIAALGFAFYAWRQQSRAKEQEQYARTQERQARKLTYIANLNLAADAIERDNIGRAFELLAQYLPGTATGEEENYLGFLWYHLMKACRVKGLPLNADGGTVNSIAWSSDSRVLASGGEDKTIKLWDVASGKELRTLRGHDAWVYSVAWSSDGKTLASGSWDKTIKLWDVASGKELRTLRGHEGFVNSVAWSSDGKTLASGCTEGTIKFWDAMSGKELRTLQGHDARVNSVAWSSDGKTLASGGEDKTIKLWDVASGKELRTLRGHEGFVNSVAWSGDGKTLASGSADGTIRLWDVANGKELYTLRGHEEVVNSVAWSSDGKTLASGDRNGLIKLWDVASGKELRTLQAHRDTINSVAWSSDGKTLASGSSSMSGFTMHNGKGHSFVSEDKTIKLWDVASGKELYTLRGHEDAINSVAWSSDGKALASGGEDKTIKLWDVASGKELYTLRGHEDAINSVAWSSDGKTLASGSDDGTIKLWDVVSGKELRTLRGHGETVNSIAWSSDSRVLASGGEDKTIKLWDVASGKELYTLRGHEDAINSVAWSSDGKTLASGSADGTIRLWDVANGKELYTLRGHEDAINSVAWSSDSRVLASGGEDKTIKLWDVASGKELRTLRGHEEVVYSVAWSSDGKTLASGSDDGTIKLWDVVSGKELRTLQRESNYVYTVAFGRDGKALASGSADPKKGHGIIRLWFAASEEEVGRQRSK